MLDSGLQNLLNSSLIHLRSGYYLVNSPAEKDNPLHVQSNLQTFTGMEQFNAAQSSISWSYSALDQRHPVRTDIRPVDSPFLDKHVLWHTSRKIPNQWIDLWATQMLPNASGRLHYQAPLVTQQSKLTRGWPRTWSGMPLILERAENTVLWPVRRRRIPHFISEAYLAVKTWKAGSTEFVVAVLQL